MSAHARRTGCAWLACLLLVTGLGACCEESGREESGPVAADESRVASAAREPAGDVRRVLVAWLQCGECRDGELRAVRKLGPTAFPLLEAALEFGPAPAALAARRLELERSYRSLHAYAAGRRRMTIGLDEKPFVDAQLGSYVALYRLRAGQALLALGAPRAAAAVERALASDLRVDAKRSLRAALADPRGPSWAAMASPSD